MTNSLQRQRTRIACRSTGCGGRPKTSCSSCILDGPPTEAVKCDKPLEADHHTSFFPMRLPAIGGHQTGLPGAPSKPKVAIDCPAHPTVWLVPPAAKSHISKGKSRCRPALLTILPVTVEVHHGVSRVRVLERPRLLNRKLQRERKRA